MSGLPRTTSIARMSPPLALEAVVVDVAAHRGDLGEARQRGVVEGQLDPLGVGEVVVAAATLGRLREAAVEVDEREAGVGQVVVERR